MPDTLAIRTRIEKAYTAWQTVLAKYNDGVPEITMADVNIPYKRMCEAIREWEKPGPSETTSTAKAARQKQNVGTMAKFLKAFRKGSAK